MQNLKKNELFRNLGDFLKSRGIELNNSSYATRIQQGCNVLTDVINVAQTGVKKTKIQVDHAMERLRETVHQNTAPPQPSQSKSARRAKPQGKRPAAEAKPHRQK